MNFWSLHKTKIMGLLVTTISYLQLPANSDFIAKTIGETSLEGVNIFAGLVILLIGVLNGGTPPSQGGDSKHVGRAAGIFMALLASLMMIGCVGTRDAYKSAHSLDDYAYIVTEHYSAVLREAADLVEQRGGDDPIVAKLRAADDKAKPLILALRPVAEAYRAGADAETEAELEKALNDAVDALTDFINLVNVARGEAPISKLQLEEKLRWTYPLQLSPSVS